MNNEFFYSEGYVYQYTDALPDTICKVYDNSGQSKKEVGEILATSLNKNISKPKVPETHISVFWLLKKHPELSRDEARSLYDYSIYHTITHKDCYGDGEKMYTDWKHEINEKTTL